MVANGIIITINPIEILIKLLIVIVFLNFSSKKNIINTGKKRTEVNFAKIASAKDIPDK